MTGFFVPIALACFAAGIVLTLVSTVYRSVPARHAASVAFVAAWVAHLLAAITRMISADHLAISNMAEYLLAFGWALLTLHLFVWFRLQVYVAGMVLPPIAAIATLAGWQVVSGGGGSTTEVPRVWFMLHTTAGTLGMATLCLALAMSLLYLLQDRALKARKTLALLQRFPALERCDRIGNQALWVGFVLLTAGIVSGVVINLSVHDRFWVAGVKQILAALAWLVFAAILGARATLGFRGPKSAYLTITGVALGLLTVLGMAL